MFLIPFDAIVVGVDFSDYSKIVMKQALLLSDMWKVPLAVAHAFNEPIDAAPTLYVSIRKSLGPDYYKDHIKSFYGLKNRKFKTFVDFSSPADHLRAVAKNYSYPLLVVGYKGHSGLTDFLFGSTARRLVLKSKTPVWVHRGVEVVRPQRVLIAHDLSDESNRGIDIFKKMNLQQTLSYQVCFVREKPYPVMDYNLYRTIEQADLILEQRKMRSLLAKYPRLDIQVHSGDVTEQLVKKTRQFDFILVSRRQRKEFYSFSETLQLMRKSTKPVMVV